MDDKSAYRFYMEKMNLNVHTESTLTQYTIN